MAGGVGEGLDDELLALAGGSARQIDLSSDDDDRVRTGSKRNSKPSATSSSSLAKKRRLDLLDEDSASGSDADAPGSDDDVAGSGSDDDSAAGRRDPYPYQGIYKSARDMEELMSMNELEREDILARRRDEINKRRQKYELAALVKAQKAAAGATKKAAKKRVVRGGTSASRGRRGRDDSDLSEESEEDEDEEEDADGDSDFAYGGSGAASAAKGRKKKLPGQTDAKSAKLSELRKKRKEKAAGGLGASRARADSDDDAAPTKHRSRRGYASSDSDDVSYSSYDDEPSSYASRRRISATGGAGAADPSSSEPPSTSDLNAARITRDLIESRLYAPRWKDALVGSFFRFSWGTRPHPSGRGTETVYRIHQVTDVIEKPGSFYDLSDDKSGRWCNVYLVFEHDGHEHEARINMLSRSAFTDSERERYIAFLKGNKQKVPKKASVVRKADELERFFTSPLTEQDIAKILETKKRLRAEAISVMGGSAVLGATAGFDSPRTGANSTPGAATPTNGAGSGAHHPAPPQSLEARLAAVNERNRALDRTKMSDVERKARTSKLAAAAAAAAAVKTEEQEKQKQQQAAAAEQVGGSVELTHQKPGLSGMGNGFVAVKNYATLVDVDLGDF